MSLNRAISAVVFVWTITGQLRCITSTASHATGTLRLIEGNAVESEGAFLPGYESTLTVPATFQAEDEVSRSRNFLEVSSEIETSALMRRVERVQTLAATQQFAVRAQQQALLGLQQEQAILAARLASLAEPKVEEKIEEGKEKEDADANDDAKTDDEKAADEKAANDAKQKAGDDEGSKEEADAPPKATQSSSEQLQKFLCSNRTTMSCTHGSSFGYGHSHCKQYGEATCSTKDECICEPGACADGHGKCSKKAGNLLPGTFKIEVHDDGDGGERARYCFMEDDHKHVDFAMGDQGPKGHWHVIVLSDNSVMLYTAAHGHDHFFTVKGDGDKATLLVDGFEAPRHTAFELHRDEKTKLIFLKDILTGLWLKGSRKMGGNKVVGVAELPEGEGFIFHPPLKDSQVKMMKASAHRIWPLLPLMFLVVAVLG